MNPPFSQDMLKLICEAALGHPPAQPTAHAEMREAVEQFLGHAKPRVGGGRRDSFSSSPPPIAPSQAPLANVPAGARFGHWMQTVSGRAFYPLDPRPEDVALEDISHGLSMLCRFGGHTPIFYSVAEHSVRVSRAVAALGGTLVEQRWANVHDAAETYCGDMVWPLKQSIFLEPFKAVEENLMRTILEHFGLPLTEPEIVKHCDLVLLATEKRDLMRRDRAGRVSIEAQAARERLGAWHSDGMAPLVETITPWTQAEARQAFEDQHRILFNLH